MPSNPRQILALSLLPAVMLIAGIYLGRYTAKYEQNAVPKMADSVETELREALKVAQADLLIEKTRHEVDSRALELVRGEMTAERERTAELQEGLSFYRSMVVSDNVENGVSLHQPELVASGTPGHYAYRVFVQQKDREYDMTEGVLSAEVLGTKAGKQVSYPMGALSKDFDGNSIVLHFRYFQAIEGELVLPEGFVPEGITLVANMSKPRQTEVNQHFPWEVQAKFINVGK